MIRFALCPEYTTFSAPSLSQVTSWMCSPRQGPSFSSPGENVTRRASRLATTNLSGARLWTNTSLDRVESSAAE